MAPEIPSYPELVTSQWSCNDEKQRFEIHNPATGEVVTTVQGGNASTAGQAVQAAQEAFENEWKWKSPVERSQLLFQCAAHLEKHAEEIAAITCIENGLFHPATATG